MSLKNMNNQKIKENQFVNELTGAHQARLVSHAGSYNLRRRFSLSFLAFFSLIFGIAQFVPFLTGAHTTANAQTKPTSEKAEPQPKAAVKSKKSVDRAKDATTELERKLKQLDNLYVPIHWSDYASGLAIGGFDPIVYFESRKAEQGDENYQYVWHGVSWQFVSKGNLENFKRTPSIYAPKFAGYDPYAISNGLLTEGLPSIWSIINGQLYLFHSEVNRYLWQENRIELKQKVRKNWDTLSLDVPRYKISGN